MGYSVGLDIERDIDILAQMAGQGLAAVYLSITMLDRTLVRTLEPRRFQTAAKLWEAGIPVGVMLAPLIPVLTDYELESIVSAAHKAGAQSVQYILLRLPLETADLFAEWLQQHYPLKAEHVMNRVHDSRGGKAYDAAFHQRQRGSGGYADLIAQRFKLITRKLELTGSLPALRSDLFRPPNLGGQMSFDFFD